MKTRIIAVIPARGGSKRIKNKNIKLFNGKPLISYCINELKKIKDIDSIVVSTDSKKIKEISERYGAEVPFFRPKKLSEDVPTEDVTLHCVKFMEKKNNYNYDIILTLEPPHIARRSSHIRKAIEVLNKKKSYDSAMTVIKIKERPEWMIYIKNKISIPYTDKFKYRNKPFLKFPSSKKFKFLYKPSAIVYAIKRNELFKYKSCVGLKCFPIKIDGAYDIDLDYPEDWVTAEKKYNEIKNK